MIKAPMTQEITKIFQNSIPLSQGRGGNAMGKRAEDAKAEATKKIVVPKITTAVFLQNNEIRSITGLPGILKEVMWNSNYILWLDLSNNYLETIEDEILNFPLLKTLYLHGNYIKELDDVKKLQGLPNLWSLTLYGNHIE